MSWNEDRGPVADGLAFYVCVVLLPRPEGQGMRIGFVLAAATVLFVVCPGGRTEERKDEAPRDPDLQKLQGTWEIVYHETAGEEDTADSKWTMVFKGDKYTFKAGDVTLTGRIRIDSTKSPKQVEYATEEDDGVQEYVGIYELNNDTYKTCDVAKGKARPTEFKTKDPTGQVAVWKRVKVKD
jgi:uncharacterized protein (TIGR03067 family)